MFRAIVTCIVLLSCAMALAEKQSPATRPVSDEPRPRMVSVTAAADLKFAMEDLIGEFRRRQPAIDVSATYGSSGNAFAQLSNKAPFDLYFSADIAYPRKLVKAGLAKKDSEFLYAVGQIVVWVPNASKLDVEKLGADALKDASVRRVAIANPKHAPYGRAAEASLKKLGLWQDVQEKLVLGENVAQTAQFVESGAADIGVIALSLALAPAMRDKGRFYVLPQHSYPALEQGGVILNWAKDMEAAQELRTFILSGDGREILRRYGFVLPETREY